MGVLIFIAMLHIVILQPVLGDDMYCGKQSCYQILDLPVDCTLQDVKRQYRKLSLVYHPDKNKEKGATRKFAALAQAYETLSDEETRKDYDYYLENPDAYMYNNAQYYKHTYAPKSDARLVVSLFLLALSAVHYVARWQRHRTALAYFRSSDKRLAQRAQELAVSRLQRRGPGSKKGGLSKRDREELARLREEALDELCADIQIDGGYAKPGLRDVLLVRFALLPVTISCWVWWVARWHWLFTIRGEKYGPKERFYLTARALGMSEGALAANEMDKKRDDLLGRELWVKKNLAKYKQEQEEEFMRKRPGLYKRYLRYRKAGGKQPFRERAAIDDNGDAADDENFVD